MKSRFLLIPAALMLGCSGPEASDSEASLADKMNKQSVQVSVSKEVLDEMVQTLPSPIETAHIIKQSNASFKKELLVPTTIAENITDKYSQAIVLGAYGVDLGYLNLNDKTLYVIEYIEALRTVAKGLKVDSYFNFSLMNDLAKNRKNVDSLIHISTENFNTIDEHFRSRSQGDLSVLILIGSWLEGLHMLNKIGDGAMSDDIKKRIGEQKILVDNIFAILGKIESMEFYKGFKQKLKPLKDTYNGVKISYTYKEPEMVEKNGELVVVDKTETSVEITDEQIKKISAEVEQLRNNLFFK